MPSISLVSVRARSRAFGLRALGSLAVVLVLVLGANVSARAQGAQRGQGEATELRPSETAPTVSTDEPAPIAEEPVARGADLGSQDALRTREPTFDGETRPRRLPNVSLLATGTVVLAAAYVPSVIGAAVSQRAGDNKLYIPIAGPFLAMKGGTPEKPGHKGLFVADGVAQSLGGLGVLLSVMIPERVTQRWYMIGRSDRFRVTPGRIARGYGLQATGTF